MSTDQPESKIELEVKNFGPIAEAKIDLRPLTVFIGRNNTGKSYLATLIYVLHQMFTLHMKDPFTSDQGFESRFAATLDPLADGDSVRKIEEWVYAYIKGDASIPSLTEEQALIDAMTSLLKTTLSGSDRTIALAEYDLARYFGVGNDLTSLVRQGSRRPLSIVVRGAHGLHSEVNGAFDYTFTVARNGFAVDCEFDSGFSYVPPPAANIDESQIDRYRRLVNDSNVTFTLRTEHDTRLRAQAILYSSLTTLSTPAFYLPADRTGVIHAQPVMVGSMIDNASRPDLSPTSSDVVLTGVLGDFLRRLVTDVSVQRDQHSDVIEQIESDILNGKVHRTLSEAGYPRFAYQPDHWDSELSLMRVSSLVSELAPVVLYLKHFVKSGDTLIIDEPEAHLHPSAQVKFAIIIARLVKSGVRVILTTHSEWMLDQFANLVRMSQLPEEARDGLDGSDAALTTDQFGAWLFETKKRPKGTVVREIDIDPEEGGLGRDYFDTAVLTHNTWAEIGNRLTALGLR